MRPCRSFDTESPILAYADFKAPFVLHTDASGDGLGTVLYQVQNGQKRVIAYASRSLSKSERNYPVHKLEFLALKWAITDKFHEYRYGSEFQVFTDSNPSTYVLTTAKLDATCHRWVAALSNYTLGITYKPGKGHVDSDALSCIRWPGAIDIDTQTVHAVCKGVQASTWQGGKHLPGDPSGGCIVSRQCPTRDDTIAVVSGSSQGPSHSSHY